MKIPEMIASAILKKGILYEAKDIDTIVDVPMMIEGQERKITISIKCDHMTLKIDKDDKIGV